MKSYLVFFMLLVWNFSFAQWQATKGPEGAIVNCISTDGNKIFIGTKNGLFISNDDGKTWISPDTIVLGKSIYAIHVFGNKLFASSLKNLYLSDNNGMSWNILPKQNFPINVTKFANCGPYVFAGTINGKLHRTIDSGKTWTDVSPKSMRGEVTGFAVFDKKILVGTISSVYSSEDYGAKWKDSLNGLNNQGVFDLNSNGNIMHQITSYRYYKISLDTGKNWTYPAIIEPGSKNLTAVTSIGNKIYVSSVDKGIFVSADSGKTWKSINTGLNSNDFRTITNKGNDIIAGSYYGGVSILKNGDSIWSTSNKGLFGTDVLDISINGNDIFVGGFQYGISHSSDKGLNWTTMNNGIGYKDIYAICNTGTSLFAGTPDAGVFRSSDNGKIWKRINAGLTDTVVSAIDFNDSIIIVGTNSMNERGIFVSFNNGDNWNYSGLIANRIYCLRTNGAYIFAGTNKGIFYSTNNGRSWLSANNGALDGKTLSVNSICTYNENLFIGTNWGIWHSSDTGKNWTNLYGYDLNNQILINSLLVYYDFIYAGSEIGMLMSKDTGKTWINIHRNLPNIEFQIMTMANDDNYLYLGLLGAGVWKGSLNEITNINRIHISSNIFQVYPNPNKGSFNIKSNSNISRIEIYDINGKLLEKINNTEISATMSINLINYNSNLYYINVFGELGYLGCKSIYIE